MTRSGTPKRSTKCAVAASAVVALGLTMMAGPPASADAADFEWFNFEGYGTAPLDGQDEWTASPGAEVVADPLDSNNRALLLQGGGESAYRAIPEITEGDTGTVFFRFLRSGPVDTSIGITDVEDPADHEDRRAFVKNQNDDAMLMGDGGDVSAVGGFAEDTWQCVWLVADNSAGEVAVYSQGGAYEDITRLPDEAEQMFGFQEDVEGALDQFFWVNGAESSGQIYIDDLAVDTSGENLEIPTGNTGDCTYDDEQREPLINPLPDPTPSTLGIEVTELAQLPESQTTPETQDERLIRHNRITHLSEVRDGSGRLAVPDNNEAVYMVDKDTGEHLPYVNVRDEFIDNFHNHAGLGTGIGSAEFHPNFGENGLFYTVHTEAGGALQEHDPDFPEYGGTEFHSVVTEWQANDPAAETFEGTHREVMRIPFAGRVHTVQQMAFNPTVEPGDADYGMLYILVGDGGNAVDNDNTQDLSTPQGTIFRVDPGGENSQNGAYGIPQDNPFLDVEDALPEIYALGMRDPHRMSWDLEGENRMYMGHIGEWQIEAVYDVEPGDNYGWSVREGPFVADNRQVYPLPEDDAEYGFTYPVLAYDHQRDPGQTGDAGVALNGGFVYRGEIPELQGQYLFTDLVRGWVLSADTEHMVRNDGDPGDLAPIDELRVFHDGKETTFQELVGDERVDLRFGSDADGELYLLSKSNGKIWKVTDAYTEPPSEDPPPEVSPIVLPELTENMVAHYDFDNPVEEDAESAQEGYTPSSEADQGQSGTDIELINGGTEMRVADAAYPGAGRALQTQQMSPTEESDDDWKAGVYDSDGVASLSAFADANETSIMGWFKPTGLHPAQNSNTEDPEDRYNAVGLAGVLSGDSNGHDVRALLEVIEVDGELKLVALGRRVDGEASWTYAADLPWNEILERDEWVHLAATFDFNAGEMQLFMNGEPLDGEYTEAENPWGEGQTSDTDPAGIKIGGSYPQNEGEANPFTGRMDDLMFLDTAVSAEQVSAQYQMFDVEEPTEPAVPSCSLDDTVTDLMDQENWAARSPELWEFPGDEIILAEDGEDPDDGIRRPFEYALLDTELPLGSLEIEAEVRLDAPAWLNNRDVILVFGYQSDTEYYYAHLSQDNTIYAHNGIFMVDGADRVRIDDQWDEDLEIGAPPAITDEEFHEVRLAHCVDTGEVAVWVDGLGDPLMTATDTTFDSGQVGFGSFDNTGRMANFSVSFQSEPDEGPTAEPSGEPPEEPAADPTEDLSANSGDDDLAVTGASVAWFAVAALVLMFGGAALMMLRRRV